MYEGIHNRAFYKLDMRWWFKGPLHVVMRGFETSVLKIAYYFQKVGKLDLFNTHVQEACGLRRFMVREVDNKLVIHMSGKGNEIRQVMALKRRLVDPAALEEPLDYDDDTWIDSRVVEIFGGALDAWARIDVTCASPHLRPASLCTFICQLE